MGFQANQFQNFNELVKFFKKKKDENPNSNADYLSENNLKYLEFNVDYYNHADEVLTPKELYVINRAQKFFEHYQNILSGKTRPDAEYRLEQNAAEEMERRRLEARRFLETSSEKKYFTRAHAIRVHLKGWNSIIEKLNESDDKKNYFTVLLKAHDKNQSQLGVVNGKSPDENNMQSIVHEVSALWDGRKQFASLRSSLLPKLAGRIDAIEKYVNLAKDYISENEFKHANELIRAAREDVAGAMLARLALHGKDKLAEYKQKRTVAIYDDVIFTTLFALHNCGITPPEFEMFRKHEAGVKHDLSYRLIEFFEDYISNRGSKGQQNIYQHLDKHKEEKEELSGSFVFVHDGELQQRLEDDFDKLDNESIDNEIELFVGFYEAGLRISLSILDNQINAFEMVQENIQGSEKESYLTAVDDERGEFSYIFSHDQYSLLTKFAAKLFFQKSHHKTFVSKAQDHMSTSGNIYTAMALGYQDSIRAIIKEDIKEQFPELDPFLHEYMEVNIYSRFMDYYKLNIELVFDPHDSSSIETFTAYDYTSLYKEAFDYASKIHTYAEKLFRDDENKLLYLNKIVLNQRPNPKQDVYDLMRETYVKLREEFEVTSIPQNGEDNSLLTDVYTLVFFEWHKVEFSPEFDIASFESVPLEEIMETATEICEAITSSAQRCFDIIKTPEVTQDAAASFESSFASEVIELFKTNKSFFNKVFHSDALERINNESKSFVNCLMIVIIEQLLFARVNHLRTSIENPDVPFSYNLTQEYLLLADGAVKENLPDEIQPEDLVQTISNIINTRTTVVEKYIVAKYGAVVKLDDDKTAFRWRLNQYQTHLAGEKKRRISFKSNETIQNAINIISIIQREIDDVKSTADLAALQGRFNLAMQTDSNLITAFSKVGFGLFKQNLGSQPQQVVPLQRVDQGSQSQSSERPSGLICGFGSNHS